VRFIISESIPIARMVVEASKAFHRRVNDDGTFDALCTCCFRTVAFAMRESYLGELERNHTCEDRLYPPINPRQIVSK
jgi:hypothetical protein